MKRWDKEWDLAIADVLMNLSAAWFALVVIAPNIGDVPVPEIIRAMFVNTALGVLALWIGVKLRKLSDEDIL